MHEEELRRVLLVKSIEEADREGTLIPPADRSAAARDARRAGGDDAERLGAERARILLQGVVARHPFVDTIFHLARGPAWMASVILALALLLGLTLSALDGTRRINLLAVPLLGIVLWNLAVYIALAADWIRARAAQAPPPRLAGMLAHFGMGRVNRLASKSGAFNATLAEALARFSSEWTDAARPLLVTRATRVFHLGAVAVGIGLILGLYFRGLAFDYQAGWESTFLDAPQVRTVLAVLYAPASWITGFAIPDVAHIEAIRWKNGAGGESAVAWIHLLAATVALFVVLPRVALALIASFAIARRSRSMPQPPALRAYFRNAFGAHGGAIGRALATVVPYAYEPSDAARAGLRALLPAALGDGVTLDMRAPVRYGEEEEFLRGVQDAGKPDIVVLLFNLAATPEEENHGAVIAGLRDGLAAKRPQAQLLVLVVEGPYATRMGADARVEERRHAWIDFVATHALGLCSIDLAAAGHAAAPSQAQIDCVRSALWQPSTA